METVTATYDDKELAWVSPVLELKRDIYLMVSLKKRGKVVIRQSVGDGKWPRVPIEMHKDMKAFCLRMEVRDEMLQIKIYTSEEPEEIKYAYI